jgi:hypothetical protein
MLINHLNILPVDTHEYIQRIENVRCLRSIFRYVRFIKFSRKMLVIFMLLVAMCLDRYDENEFVQSILVSRCRVL